MWWDNWDMLGCWQQGRLGAQAGKEQETPEHLGNLGKQHLGNLSKQHTGNLGKQHLGNLGMEPLSKDHLTNCTWSEPNLSAVAID